MSTRAVGTPTQRRHRAVLRDAAHEQAQPRLVSSSADAARAPTTAKTMITMRLQGSTTSGQQLDAARHERGVLDLDVLRAEDRAHAPGSGSG